MSDDMSDIPLPNVTFGIAARLKLRRVWLRRLLRRQANPGGSVAMTVHYPVGNDASAWEQGPDVPVGPHRHIGNEVEALLRKRRLRSSQIFVTLLRGDQIVAGFARVRVDIVFC